MKARLLNQLRKLAKRKVKIDVDNDGDFRIKKLGIETEFLFLNSRDEWEWWSRGRYFGEIEVAKDMLTIGRRMFILDIVKKIRIARKRKLVKRF